jgi:hypothetical protein
MKVLGIVVVVLALVIGIVPQFTNCQYAGSSLQLANGKTAPMKCFWTAQAELAVAGPLVVLGGVLAFTRRRETRGLLSLMGVVLGAFTIALPTDLIGVCSATMKSAACNTIEQPTLILSGGLVIVASLVGLVIARRQKEIVP